MKAQEFDNFDKFEFKESAWCSFVTENKEKVLIGNIYHSGSSSEENTTKMLNIIKDINTFKQFDRVIITGDFNFPNIKWRNDNPTGKDAIFYESLQEGFFIQHVNQPTRYRSNQESNILDLVLTQDQVDIQNIEYCSPLGKSDHILLKIKTNIIKEKTLKMFYQI